MRHHGVSGRRSIAAGVPARQEPVPLADARATDGPLLVTSIRYVMFDDGWYVLASDVLTMATSAWVVTAVRAVALLFALLGSDVSLLTTALLTMMVPDGVPGSTFPTTRASHADRE